MDELQRLARDCDEAAEAGAATYTYGEIAKLVGELDAAWRERLNRQSLKLIAAAVLAACLGFAARFLVGQWR